jgi:hypothetical protein
MSTLPPTPLQRLAQSRSRLSLALHNLHATQGTASQTAASSGLSGLFDVLGSEPGVRVLVAALGDWWKSQSWQQSATLAADAAKQLLRPMAQRHPLGLAASAFAVGAALVLLKPWRWVSVPTLAAGLLPPLLIKILAQMPPTTWSDLLHHWLQAQSQANPTP